MSSVKYFDAIAEDWNVIRSEYFNEKIRGIALSQVAIKDKVCADLGCGTGFISLTLAEQARLVFSVDTSVNMLKVLKNTALNDGRSCIFPIKGSMDDIPLFDHSVDAVFSNMALHHVKDAGKAILEMHRILKPGGTLVITDVEEHTGEWARLEMHDEWLGFSRAQLVQWFDAAGFTDIWVTGTGLTCKGNSSQGELTETGIFLAKGTKREALTYYI